MLVAIVTDSKLNSPSDRNPPLYAKHPTVLWMWLFIATFTMLLSVWALQGFVSAAPAAHWNIQAIRIQDTAPLLRWKFKTGEQFVFDFDQTIRLEKDVAGIKTTQSTSQRSQISWEILAADDESAEVEMRYARVDFELETSDGLIKTSTDPNFPKVANGKAARLAAGLIEAVAPIIDQPFVVKFSNRGELLEVKMDATIVEQIRKAPNSMAIRSTISQEGIKEILATLLVQFPEVAASNWEIESKVVVAGVPLSRACKYEVKGQQQNNPTLEIAYQTTVDFPEKFIVGETSPSDDTNEKEDPATRPSDAKAPFDFDPTSKKWPRIARQESNGSMQFQIEEGYATSGKSNSLLVTEKAYSNVLIKTTIVTETTVKVTKK